MAAAEVVAVEVAAMVVEAAGAGSPCILPKQDNNMVNLSVLEIEKIKMLCEDLLQEMWPLLSPL